MNDFCGAVRGLESLVFTLLNMFGEDIDRMFASSIVVVLNSENAGPDSTRHNVLKKTERFCEYLQGILDKPEKYSNVAKEVPLARRYLLKLIELQESHLQVLDTFDGGRSRKEIFSVLAKLKPFDASCLKFDALYEKNFGSKVNVKSLIERISVMLEETVPTSRKCRKLL